MYTLNNELFGSKPIITLFKTLRHIVKPKRDIKKYILGNI